MMVDRYTKTILTVIALSLVVIAAENLHWSAKAQSRDVQKVAICDVAGVFCADTEPLPGDPAHQGLSVVNHQ